MPITISAVASPVYTAPDNSTIDVELTTKEYGQIPSTLHASDPVAYTMNGESVTNAQLYAQAAAGAFGAVGAYVAPAPASITVQMWQAEAVLKATPFLPSQAVPTVQAAVAAATNLWDATEALVVAQGNASLTAFLERSTTLSSNDPTLSSIATALGVTSAQISALFAQASALTF